MRQQLASLFGEPQDPDGDTRLSQQWASYGQARNCKGGAHGTPPVTPLTCGGAACTIQSPAANSTVTSPVTIKATYAGAIPPNHFEAWDDGNKLGNVPVGSQDTMTASFSIGAGAHKLTVLAVDGDGNVIKSVPLQFTAK